jgi:hypothetical protein
MPPELRTLRIFRKSAEMAGKLLRTPGGFTWSEKEMVDLELQRERRRRRQWRRRWRRSGRRSGHTGEGAAFLDQQLIFIGYFVCTFV